VSPAIFRLGVRCLFRARSFASTHSPLLRPRPLQEGAEPFQSLVGFASRGVLAPTDTSTPGAPSSSATRLLAEARVGRRSPNPRRCRPQGSCPSRRFWLARGSLGTFWVPPFAVAPDASRPCSMPLASLERPFRAFPSREAVPTLAGLVLPCGFAFDCRRRSACRSFTVAFACRASSLPIEPTRRWIRDARAGTKVPCDR